MINILKNLFHIGKLRDVVDGVAGAGHQVEVLLRAVGDHIRHIEGNLRGGLFGNLDHAGRKIHARRLDTRVLQDPAQHTGAAG